MVPLNKIRNNLINHIRFYITDMDPVEIKIITRYVEEALIQARFDIEEGAIIVKPVRTEQ